MKFPKTVTIEYDLDSGTASIDGQPLQVNDLDALVEIGNAVTTHVMGAHLKETVLASQFKRGPSSMPKDDETDDVSVGDLDTAKASADVLRYFTEK